MITPTPDEPDPVRPLDEPAALPSRSAAARRRAMQGAIANVVRAMRSAGGRRGPRRGPQGPSSGRL